MGRKHIKVMTMKQAFKYNFITSLLNKRELLLYQRNILIEEWRKEYNQTRPHSALGYRPPAPEAIMMYKLRR